MKRIVFFAVLTDLFLIAVLAGSMMRQRNRLPVGVPVPATTAVPGRVPTATPVPPFSPQAVTLEGIFTRDHAWTATLSAVRRWTLVASGDIIPARSTNNASVARDDFLWPYQEIAPVLAAGDVTFINLETPLLAACNVTVSGMVFCGSSRHVAGLERAGVDVVNFANNHMGNYGAAGIAETEKLLADHAMDAAGLDRTVYRTVKGKRVAFLGFNDIPGGIPPVAEADAETIQKEVSAARRQADIVAVTFHWGTEYVRQPGARQRELAHRAVDAGADLVLGNHPHWIQPLELYRGKLIIYAHGNTVFDQMWSEETKYGVIGTYTFFDTTLVDVDYAPTYIIDYGRATVLTGERKDRVLQMLHEESVKLRDAPGSI